jgi:hypothetical protein
MEVKGRKPTRPPKGTILVILHTHFRSLAHAVLQLHSAPWLESTWSNKDIQIRGGASNVSDGTSWHPSISRSFGSVFDILEPIKSLAAEPSIESTFETESMSLVPISTQRKGLALRNQSRPRVRNREVYNLGIILVELAFNSTLELKREKQDYDDIPVPDAGASGLITTHLAAYWKTSSSGNWAPAMQMSFVEKRR